MYDVLIVADTLLKIAKNKGKTLTPMQLVKLSYISHGWYLTSNDLGLFSNFIEAWSYGPIIPDLYHATKSYNNQPIPLDAIGSVKDIQVKPANKAFLTAIFNKYGHLNNITLGKNPHLNNTQSKNTQQTNI